MNSLILSNESNTTMSSKEISDLTGKAHKNVMRDIRNQLQVQNIGQLKYESTYKTIQKKPVSCFELDYEQTIILISGYSISLRAKIIKRWSQLELQNATKPQPPTQLQLAKQVVELLEQQDELLLKAQVADELANTEGLFLPSLAGKIISGHPNIFCDYLVSSGVMFRRKNKLLPYSKYADKYFKVKVSTYKEKSIEQSYFTARGLAWIQARYIKSNNLLKLDYQECINE